MNNTNLGPDSHSFDIDDDIVGDHLSLRVLQQKIAFSRNNHFNDNNKFPPFDMHRSFYLSLMEQKDHTEIVPRCIIFSYALVVHYQQHAKEWLHHLEPHEQKMCLEDLHTLKQDIETLVESMTQTDNKH